MPGGAVDPGTMIVSSNCQITGLTVTVDVSYDTDLNVGQRWESEIFVGGDLMTDESQFFSCNQWTPTGAGMAARGCQRDAADQPSSQIVGHTYTASFQSLPAGVNVMIIANALDTAGGFSVGTQAVDNFDCF